MSGLKNISILNFKVYSVWIKNLSIKPSIIFRLIFYSYFTQPGSTIFYYRIKEVKV